MTLGYLVQRNSGWAVALGLLTIGVYLLVWLPDPALLIIWVGNMLLVLMRHREDLRQPPVWRFGSTSNQDDTQSRQG
jgi:hypothetical protein